VAALAAETRRVALELIAALRELPPYEEAEGDVDME
jgi:hypothetical protein